MARFLFVVPPLTGHTNPTVSIAAALARRGHESAWVLHGDAVGSLVPPDATVFDADVDPAARAAFETARREAGDLRGPEAFRFLWSDFLVPLARAMVAPVEQAVDRFRPDALVVDQQALAGALVARRRSMAHATTATTSAELVDPLADLPKVAAWLDHQLARLEDEFGARAPDDLRFSPHLVLALTTEQLAGPVHNRPAHWVFVGPLFADRPDVASFPWDRLGAPPRVLVTLGTVPNERGVDFLAHAMEAVAELDVRGVVVGPGDRLPPPPAGVVVQEFIPQMRLLPHMSAVVCHGGHNTVCESLAHGLPLVIAPIRDDQPIVARQVVEAGAGIRIKYGRSKAAHIRSALAAVLGEATYKDGAERIRASFAAAGGADEAASRLEELACV